MLKKLRTLVCFHLSVLRTSRVPARGLGLQSSTLRFTGSVSPANSTHFNHAREDTDLVWVLMSATQSENTSLGSKDQPLLCRLRTIGPGLMPRLRLSEHPTSTVNHRRMRPPVCPAIFHTEEE